MIDHAGRTPPRQSHAHAARALISFEEAQRKWPNWGAAARALRRAFAGVENAAREALPDF
jgi:hypothetical protein